MTQDIRFAPVVTSTTGFGLRVSQPRSLEGIATVEAFRALFGGGWVEPPAAAAASLPAGFGVWRAKDGLLMALEDRSA